MTIWHIASAAFFITVAALSWTVVVFEIGARWSRIMRALGRDKRR